MVKISVIIPVYNAEATLERCLNALISQTFKDFEVICIDDGSKDKSFEILKNFAQKDSRIKVFSQENSGPAKTRYNAIEKSTGEYLMFCDADDWYEKEMIEQMYTAITEKDVDIVMCDCNVIDISKNALQTKSSKRYHLLTKIGYSNIEEDFFEFINAVLWNKIFKRELLDINNIKYPQRYEHDDLVFVQKYCICAKSYFGLDKKLYNYIVGNPNSIMGKVYTKTNKKNPFDFILAYDDLYSFIENNVYEKSLLYLIESHFKVIRKFYDILDTELKLEAYRYLQKFIKEHPIVLDNERFKAIANAPSFKEFHKIMTTKEKQKVSFLEQIFSIKNEVQHKVIRILGIKIKLYKGRN